MADQKFRLLDMPEAKEELVILFPRLCLGRDGPYNRINAVAIDQHAIRATVLESYDGLSNRLVYFDFDHAFRLTRAFVSSQYQEEHLGLERTGVLRHSWHDDDASLSKDIVYRRPTAEVAADDQR